VAQADASSAMAQAALDRRAKERAADAVVRGQRKQQTLQEANGLARCVSEASTHRSGARSGRRGKGHSGCCAGTAYK
jgi:hypothetical protein